MTKEPSEKLSGRGYGNIYTPHAGSMIIQVQRESGLANRTIILTQRQVRLLRRGAYAAGTILAIVVLSWFFLATQAARVPGLTHRVQTLQQDVTRLDTLQAALTALESRFQQVQHMLGASTPQTGEAASNPATSPAADTSANSIPSQWPLAVAGTIVARDDTTSSTRGMDIDAPSGTEVRASGAGSVVEVSVDSSGTATVRIAHRDGYETTYADVHNVRLSQKSHVAAGAVIGVLGSPTNALPAHLHFEVLHNGSSVDPMSLMKQGPSNGDLQ
ncbi:MAG TPA: M23 family metallopeptidase [Gemmatimonadaceae bacterium]|nr:M23 family metallopeptidase [Gemmatimonadaceae bacterium]